MHQDLGQPLPRAWGFVAMLAVLPALLLIGPGLLMVDDGGARTVLAVCLIATTVLLWAVAGVLISTGVLVGTQSVSRTFANRVLFTIELERVECVEVRPRYGGAEITAWTTRDDGRRVGVYASPLVHAATRPLLDALTLQVEARPELLVTQNDRAGYAYALENT